MNSKSVSLETQCSRRVVKPRRPDNFDYSHLDNDNEDDDPDVPAIPNRATEMRFHPLAEILPGMSPPEFESLVESISTVGLREPIITYQGHIIDGRHRYLACRQLGITPIYREWDGCGSTRFSRPRPEPATSTTDHKSAHDGRRSGHESSRGRSCKNVGQQRGSTHRAMGKFAHIESGTCGSMRPSSSGLHRGSIHSAKDVLAKGVPDLVIAVSAGLVKIDAAGLIAELPAHEQAKIVVKGSKGIRESAAQIHDAKRSTSPVTAIADEEAVASAERVSRNRIKGGVASSAPATKKAIADASIESEADASTEREEMDESASTKTLGRQPTRGRSGRRTMSG